MINETKIFYDQFVNKLVSDYLTGNPRTEAAIKHCLRWMPSGENVSILDLGCGIGWTTYELKSHNPTANVQGVDLSSVSIEIAKQLFSDETIAFYSADLTKDALTIREPVDYITLIDVYEHIPTEERLSFNQMLDDLSSASGMISLTCPTRYHQDFLRKEKPDGLQPVDEDITLEILQELASSFGGDIIYFEYKSIWKINDYLHATIAKDVSYGKGTSPCDAFSIELEGSSSRLARIKNSDLTNKKEIHEMVNYTTESVSRINRLRKWLRLRTRIKAFMNA